MPVLDPISLAQDLIRCPSVTPVNAGALDVLLNALERLGFICKKLVFSEADTPDIENLYARLGTDAPNFCFAGHTDVVPAGDLRAWTQPPFGGEIVNGVLFGRGAVDMKGAIAAFAAAVSRFLDIHGTGFGGSISFLITGDEEGPSINGTRKVLQWMTQQDEVIDVCLVGEPTNPDNLGDMIKIGRRGSMSGFITITGIQGHSAHPHLADNPIHRLLRVCDRLLTPLDKGTEHFQPTCLQVTTIDVGNKATNIIPDRASATFNIRFNDLHKSDDLENWICEILKEEAPNCHNLRLERTGEAFLTPTGEFSDLLAAAVKSVTGIKPELSTSGGTSDARFIKDYCQVAEFGLIGRTIHKVDEQVPVETIYRLTDVYLAVLENYFSR